MSPRRARPSAKGTAYDPQIIGHRVNEQRIAIGLEVKQLADALKWDKSEYTRKITQGKTPVWLGEWAKLREVLRGWRGFPFTTAAEGQLLDAVGDRIGEVLAYLARTPPPNGKTNNRTK